MLGRTVDMGRVIVFASDERVKKTKEQVTIWANRFDVRPAELGFDARSMYERDSAGIPTGRLVPPPPGPWDDCFTHVVSGPSVNWPGALRVSLSSSATYWVVYNEPEHALCVEPQTGPPDALNIAQELVSSDRPLVAEARIAWVVA